MINENRGMGNEIEHSIECYGFKCLKCNKPSNVSGSIWEYPEGVYNYDDLQVSKE